MVGGNYDIETIGVTAVTNNFPEFKQWALSFVKNNESLDICLPSFLFGGFTWTCSTLRKRLRIFSGSGSGLTTITGSVSSNGARSSTTGQIRGRSMATITRSPLGNETTGEPSDYFGDIASEEESEAEISFLRRDSSPMIPDSLSPPRQGMLTKGIDITSAMVNKRGSSFDWTRLPVSAALPRHIQFARSIDWGSTALGPMEDWTFDLRAMVSKNLYFNLFFEVK